MYIKMCSPVKLTRRDSTRKSLAEGDREKASHRKPSLT